MEETKNNNKKRETRNMERTVDDKENVGSERRSGGTMFKTVDT